MNKKQLERVLQGFDSRFERLVFLFYWLEDINFHSEGEEIAKMFSVAENDLENNLCALDLVASKAHFEASHWAGIMSHAGGLPVTLTEAQVAEKLEKLRKGDVVYLDEKSLTPIFWRKFRGYVQAKDMARMAGRFFGWGTEGALELSDMKELLDAREKEDHKRYKQELAYNVD